MSAPVWLGIAVFVVVVCAWLAVRGLRACRAAA
ncbi:MAG: hypothetical protein H6R46_1542, partial [Proteobacteria bacterium]|nr:hypothetical protein [Pseudomonadota bacterium]